MARVRIAVTQELRSIVDGVGGDPNLAIYRNGVLDIPDVSQSTLDTFLSTFNNDDANRVNRKAFIKEQINQLLLDSDWTQLDDAPISASLKTQFATYRTNLRVIKNSNDPRVTPVPNPPGDVSDR